MIAIIDLLALTCRLYLSPSTTIDRTVLTKLLNVILSRSTIQCDIDVSVMFGFYHEALESLR